MARGPKFGLAIFAYNQCEGIMRNAKYFLS